MSEARPCPGGTAEISRWQVRSGGRSHRFHAPTSSAPAGAVDSFAPSPGSRAPAGAQVMVGGDPVVLAPSSLHHRLISGNPPGFFARGGLEK